MKAIVYEAYGSADVLRLEEVQKPLPKDNEVLVKVHAASLNAADWHILIGKPYYLRLMGGLRKPRNHILGDDLAGRIEAVGRNVKQCKPGDEVFGVSSFGAFAVQLARHYGAEVTAVCCTRNLQMARSIGADHVVDYTKEDFTQSGQRYDLILGISGYHPLADYKRALRPQGIYISVGGTRAQYFQALRYFGQVHAQGKVVIKV